ncbi:MAG: 8-oxo-dGDP phosphatase [Actinomycetota bacterium]|jgi:8-oxo-dGTP pyrophosphatase MutT (NUDIX family)|nr:8-oxo-dGDP phosphatase [Actinomycetota bacterium]
MGEVDDPPIRRLSTRLVYRNAWLAVHEDRIERQDGSEGIYSVIERPDFALVMATENDGFHLVDQYRYPVRGRYWEFPQGCFPDWGAGTQEELARAELAEETGLRAGALRHLGHMLAWHGASPQACDVFVATDLTPGPPDREPSEQDMRHRWVTRGEFERMIRDGEIKDNSTIAAYGLYLLAERGSG